MMIGTARIIRGNALALPLGDASVDLVVTSPPYFGLRSYQDDGAHYAGQIGSEATPAEFVDTLIAATREMVRVLKPSGSIWVNLGDKYNSAASGQNGTSATGLEGGRHDRMSGRGTTVGRIPTKSLMGIPWRYALRCIDDLGLILRAEIIWAKPNGLPESVTDRVRRSHEQWFHFTREPRYFSAVDEIREEHVATTTGRNTNGWKSGPIDRGVFDGNVRDFATSPLGKLPGSVWTINEGESLVRSVLTAVSAGGVSVDEGERLLWTLTACANGEHAQGPPSVWVVPTQPLTVPPELGVDHFAAFPMEWPRRIIQGWSPAGVCTVCGEGRQPVTELGEIPVAAGTIGGAGKRDLARDTGQATQGTGGAYNSAATRRFNRSATITGYACGCLEPTAPTRPAVILDPFMGTGTTLLVAKALGRDSVGTDLSADYCRLAEWRCNDPGQMAAALQVERPDPVSPDQLELFGEYA